MFTLRSAVEHMFKVKGCIEYVKVKKSSGKQLNEW